MVWDKKLPCLHSFAFKLADNWKSYKLGPLAENSHFFTHSYCLAVFFLSFLDFQTYEVRPNKEKPPLSPTAAGSSQSVLPRYFLKIIIINGSALIIHFQTK